MAQEEVVKGKPLNELLTHSLVDIYVGPDNHHWPLHEKLLTTRSAFFSQLFRTTTRFGLPDDSDAAFKLFVGWLYSGRIPPPTKESELTELLELALMGERWAIAGLVREVLETVRGWYARTDTYPGLRRVQYVYANTEVESPVRAMMVGAVARMLALRDPGEGIPRHWEKALRRDGELAVEIIVAIQGWRLGELVSGEEKVPDTRRGVAGMREKESVKKVERLEDKAEDKVGKIDIGDKKEDLEKDVRSEGEDTMMELTPETCSRRATGFPVRIAPDGRTSVANASALANETKSTLGRLELWTDGAQGIGRGTVRS
ncbi:hypothetical protein P152DRAFT_468003 [Eremomyces bilateralis CBS 781.70]|uniref:BTB domain-containing protein n=1 Tax=Eremomyces bilateralis CBS 781.70 TaxID=1392243 RepID=A0A6G1FWE8_9PEZI|nr:uncharacterized protein P152DRAFT_468003 [Eremomyces bilateralis CBS 781.70]KAF1810022.1 hypothetical protein P152DRAFT_468003 [Eremomyces bilateralis CBS 781.70]